MERRAVDRMDVPAMQSDPFIIARRKQLAFIVAPVPLDRVFAFREMEVAEKIPHPRAAGIVDGNRRRSIGRHREGDGVRALGVARDGLDKEREKCGSEGGTVHGVAMVRTDCRLDSPSTPIGVILSGVPGGRRWAGTESKNPVALPAMGSGKTTEFFDCAPLRMTPLGAVEREMKMKRERESSKCVRFSRLR